MKITLDLIILIAISLYCIKMLVMDNEKFTCVGSDDTAKDTCDVFYSEDANISVDENDRVIIDNDADGNDILCVDDENCVINFNDVATIEKTDSDGMVTMSEGTVKFIDTNDVNLASFSLSENSTTSKKQIIIAGKEPTCDDDGNCTSEPLNINVSNVCLSDGTNTNCFIPEN